MGPEEFRLIREFVADEFGLVLDEGRGAYLTAKLLPRLQELRLESFTDYFFREDAQLEVLAANVLPVLKDQKQKRGERRIRIISAGCSSGEEVYTLAMILLESGHFLWDWDLRITGIDIDPEMIDRANQGLYNGRAFQSTSSHYLGRYFNKTEEGLQVKDALRRVTMFKVGNLLSPDCFMGHEAVDMIFCRNVFIYFSDDTTKRVVESFATLLNPEGFLFLGHSESLSRLSSRYFPERYPGAIIYRKRD
jgi:chemotaxis protein methyltransferase CheR